MKFNIITLSYFVLIISLLLLSISLNLSDSNVLSINEIQELDPSSVSYFTFEGDIVDIKDYGNRAYLTIIDKSSLTLTYFKDNSSNSGLLLNQTIIGKGHISNFNSQKSYILDNFRLE